MQKYTFVDDDRWAQRFMEPNVDGGTNFYLASEVDAELDTMNLAVGYFHEENDRFIKRIAELEKRIADMTKCDCGAILSRSCPVCDRDE